MDVCMIVRMIHDVLVILLLLVDDEVDVRALVKNPAVIWSTFTDCCMMKLYGRKIASR